MKYLMILLFFVPFYIHATDPGQFTEVTLENFERLGWSVTIEEGNDGSDLQYGFLKFPAKISEEYRVVGVQFFLNDFAGNPLSMSSSNAKINDDTPELIFAYNSSNSDAGACIQYGIAREEETFDIRNYCIRSFEPFYLNQSQ
ncbi:hypothetical protein SAMN06297229_1526 [Pseudidiomarina planktonica]|uniref:Uncharacterized protein n=1 Tax=Pseudidiomarina planktonica TaxID=1323738 RepID=A0A1Y6EUP8_9GAMM|nr:hypothetical protein [Pseudidiomarina planktonica]RUO65110.1 hypothetical protein CWI77_01145 [Pseudidiomarina planktonica]SMQ66448.1 hypothetical protein SAMN06297229_1526 [Pseudidiomarina planktonica]